MPTVIQESSGGVAFRWSGDRLEVALISVSSEPRWQLPKGIIDEGETSEITAVREVREEAGIVTELIEPLDRVEYWFFATRGGKRVRYHKFVHFFLLRYLTGDVNDHDHEVNEARWVEINEAIQKLTFESDRRIVRMALEKIVPAST